MILATVDTGHYLWSVLVEDKGEAEPALLRAYAAFCKKNPHADPDWMGALINADEVTYQEMTPGVVLCDGSPVFGA